MAKIHKHLMVDATINRPPNNPDFLNDWLERLVKAVDMEVFMEPRSKYCDDPSNSGITGAVIITTSHGSIHVWDNVEQPFLKADLYSCKEFDANQFLELIKEFDPVEVHYTIIDRTQHPHKIDEQGYINYHEDKSILEA